MSLMPVVIREPEDSQVTQAERIIYKRFIHHVDTGTTVPRAVLRAAWDCGVRRRRVLDVIYKVNESAGVFD